jgi:hypothetical protein
LVQDWCTNEWQEHPIGHRGQFWSDRPGENLPPLIEVMAAVSLCLGTHLQHQNDRDAYELISLLRWLDSKGALDEMGTGLLKGLRATEARGVGPKE